MKYLLIILVFIFLLFDCNGSIYNSSSKNSSSIGNIAISKNIIVYDINGKIGNALEVSDESIKIYSPKGYIYQIDWQGNIIPSSFVLGGEDVFCPNFFYSDNNCTGSPFCFIFDTYGYSKTYSGKMVSYGKYLNKLYIPKIINYDGTAYCNKNSKVDMSSYDSFGICQTGYHNMATTYAIELKETDRNTIGIPNIIMPPLYLSFE